MKTISLLFICSILLSGCVFVDANGAEYSLSPVESPQAISDECLGQVGASILLSGKSVTSDDVLFIGKMLCTPDVDGLMTCWGERFRTLTALGLVINETIMERIVEQCKVMKKIQHKVTL